MRKGRVMSASFDRWRLRIDNAKRVLRAFASRPLRFAFGEEKVDAAIARIEHDVRGLDIIVARSVDKTIDRFYGSAAPLREEFSILAARLRRDLAEKYGLNQLREHLRLLRSL